MLFIVFILEYTSGMDTGNAEFEPGMSKIIIILMIFRW